MHTVPVGGLLIWHCVSACVCVRTLSDMPCEKQHHAYGLAGIHAEVLAAFDINTMANDVSTQ